LLISMLLLAVNIGLLVIFLTMYTTVIERTRDIGVLKSLGANRWFVVRALLSDSAVLFLLGFREQRPDNEPTVCAKRFQDADVPGTFNHRSVHREKNNQQPDGDGQQDHGVDEGLQARNICRSHQGKIILERTDGVIGKEVANVLHYVFGVLGACTLYKEDAGFVPSAHQFLQSSA